MEPAIYFGGSAAAGIIGWVTILATIIWPKNETEVEGRATQDLHGDPPFFRYFGTTFLIVGLVSRKPPLGFADPAAFGDLTSLGLA